MELMWLAALLETGVDTGSALRRFSGNSVLYRKLLLKFPQDDTFEKTHPAVQVNDWEAAAEEQHTLKGVVSNLGLTPLFADCTETVSLLREEKQGEAAQSYEKLRHTYEEFIEVIRSIEEAREHAE